LELAYLAPRKGKAKMNWKEEKGAATAEYAIATMAAVGFAGLLVVIMRSDEVKSILFDLVRSALSFSGN
jgi:Flp pilus assembly pilin Flp